MKLIAFTLIYCTCTYKVTSSKLPHIFLPEIEDTDAIAYNSPENLQSNADSLNTRDIDHNNHYASYIPADYGNLSFISNWVESIASSLMPSYQEPTHDTQTYYPYYTDHNQEQWSSQSWPYIWSQSYPTTYPNQLYYPNQVHYPNTGEQPQWVGGTHNPNSSSFHHEQYQQPAVTKKISTVFNTEDSKEIKHKVIISPEHPEGTGYISIGNTGGNQLPGNSSKDGKVYYRF